ncbi:MAG: sigma-70 family RNA polymerase sigma factor [Bryobacteraceae bacterium]
MSTTTTRPTTKAAKAWHAYRSSSSPESEQAFIERHLPLVKTVVGRMRMTLPQTLDFDDLHSVGIGGLMTAVRKYDPSQSCAFPSFAMTHIRGAVLDELRRMDLLSRGSREKAKKLQDTIVEIEQRLGRPATEEEMQKTLNVSAEQYGQMLEEVKPVTFLSLDSAAYTDDTDDIALHETIEDDEQISARDQLEKKELIRLVMERLQQLPDVPKKIMAMYYFEEMRLAEIAAVFGLTESRISQIHTQTVLGLRAFLERVLLASTRPQPCS